MTDNKITKEHRDLSKDSFTNACISMKEHWIAALIYFFVGGGSWLSCFSFIFLAVLGFNNTSSVLQYFDTTDGAVAGVACILIAFVSLVIAWITYYLTCNYKNRFMWDNRKWIIIGLPVLFSLLKIIF